MEKRENCSFAWCFTCRNSYFYVCKCVSDVVEVVMWAVHARTRCDDHPHLLVSLKALNGQPIVVEISLNEALTKIKKIP